MVLQLGGWAWRQISSHTHTHTCHKCYIYLTSLKILLPNKGLINNGCQVKLYRTGSSYSWLVIKYVTNYMSTGNWRVCTVISDDAGVHVTKNKMVQTKNSALPLSKPAFRPGPFTHTYTRTQIFKANSLPLNQHYIPRSFKALQVNVLHEVSLLKLCTHRIHVPSSSMPPGFQYHNNTAKFL